ncbi:hypothetical protein [Micromonospora auratinigra]|uniref:Uncharacterized protein n=1 Tax=Micromonospora auratinigra TaxID=261654 RepID=A0A1A8ZAQ9_9ACTN|nr:hypothetical protein [Micromonospora auratinigra]SBT40887.1 hypothetical protein GA0070611_1424 [Micromonospora auratinigra]
MRAADALTRLQDAAVLWSARAATPAEVIEAACDCLVAGVDGPSLRILAGISGARGGDSGEPRRWLGDTLAELSLTHYREGSRDAEDAAVRIMARRLLAGHLTPRELTAWAYRYVTRDGTPLTEELLDLDNAYEYVEAVVHDGQAYPTAAAAEVDAYVIAEARRLVGDTATGPAPTAHP